MAETRESERHPVSGRCAVVEDDGDSAWLLLTNPDGVTIAADCWLYNRRHVTQAELGRWPRDRPPPALDDLIDPGALRTAPLHDHVTFLWDRHGESVAARLEDEVLGFIAAGERRGHSKYLRRASDWGAPFDTGIFRRLFETEQPAA